MVARKEEEMFLPLSELECCCPNLPSRRSSRRFPYDLVFYMSDHPLSSTAACFKREVRPSNVVQVIGAMDNRIDGARINIRCQISHRVPHWLRAKGLNPPGPKDS